MDLLSSGWCWISVRAETESPGLRLLHIWCAVSLDWCLKQIFGKFRQNRYVCSLSQDMHVKRKQEDHVFGMCRESCWLLGLSHLHVTPCKIILPSCMLRASLWCRSHRYLLACLNFWKSSNLGGLGLHMGITNTRMLHFLLCFAGAAFLETFSKTLNWIFTLE